MISLRDKIRGCFLGISVGDGLGAPVEMKTAAEIQAEFGWISGYVPFTLNKYLKGSPIGTVTDDTQLSLAVAEAIIENEGTVDIACIAKHHIYAYQEGPVGWGGSTKEAVQRLMRGVKPSLAGMTDIPNRGMGNGVAMKAAPIGVYCAVTGKPYTDFMTEFAIMTHHTNMAVSSGAAWAEAIRFLLTEEYEPKAFARCIIAAAEWGNDQCDEKTEDNIVDRLTSLFGYQHFSTSAKIMHACDGAGPYVYQSLPAALLFFMNSPDSFDCVLNTVNAGGDTDTTTSMVASALGARLGTSCFSPKLVDDFEAGIKSLEVANRLCDSLGVK